MMSQIAQDWSGITMSGYDQPNPNASCDTGIIRCSGSFAADNRNGEYVIGAARCYGGSHSVSKSPALLVLPDASGITIKYV